MSSRFDLYDQDVEATWTDSSISKHTIGATLRKEAEMAENGGGMYYSGWALSERADAIEDLMRENEKLREFAKYAIYCAEGDLRCEGCPLRDKSNTAHVICHMHRIARELGIEVEA